MNDKRMIIYLIIEIIVNVHIVEEHELFIFHQKHKNIFSIFYEHICQL